MKRFAQAVLALLPLLGSARTLPAGDDGAGDGPLVFESRIRPLLKAHCFHCHGEQGKPKGKLDVRLRRLLVQGGKTGPSVVPGSRDKSLLYRKLVSGEMPPEEAAKRPTKEEIETIGRWIDAGAPTARPEPESALDPAVFSPEERSHWSLRPVGRPEPPAGADRSPIDRFLRASLAAKGLGYSPEADRLVLLRRATFDLTGLPPSADETAGFLADEAPDAYERLVVRLLASPHYGERWGRHWLDVAGYSDSDGCDARDAERKWAWRYRDYVVRAFNADKPFDAFVREQLAGDELGSGPADVERLAATGYLRMAPDGTAGAEDKVVAQNDVVADTIKGVTTGLLGLTVGCAQCHNHRYDPVTQLDYYRIRAVFEPAFDLEQWRTPDQRLVSLYTPEQRKAAVEIEAKAKEIEKERDAVQAEAIRAQVEKELLKVPEELRAALREAQAVDPPKRTAGQQALLKTHPTVNVSAGSLYLYDAKAADRIKAIGERAATLRATRPPEEFVHALTERPGRLSETRLFHRGDPRQAKEPVGPGVLSVLGGTEIAADDPAIPTSGRRLAFARWLVDGRHPLVARVLVNRVWMHHFGRGIVATPADFGVLGARPTHPELLDWLARDLMENGWTLKRVHRMLMTSTAYRQASRRRPEGEAADPDNQLLWRQNVKRLEAESIRDAMLAAAGALNRKMFGPPVPVMRDEVGQIVVGKENLDGEGKAGKPIPLHGEEFRRSLYVQSRRSRPLSMLECFDAPITEPSCEARSVSTVAPQALLLMNNGFVLAEADRFAARLRREAGADPSAQAERAWTIAYARPPRPEEAKRAVEFLGRMKVERLCQALLTSNEFLYVD